MVEITLQEQPMNWIDVTRPLLLLALSIITWWPGLSLWAGSTP